MTASESVRYRLALAAGFLEEATQDRELGRWRSCVDNRQLVVENSGKAVLLLYGVSPKTHDPGRQLTELLRTAKPPESLRTAELAGDLQAAELTGDLPATELAGDLPSAELAGDLRADIAALADQLLLLGPAQHVMTDYGDESTSTLPWDLFTSDSGEEALAVASRALALARAITARFHPPARNP